MRLSKLQKYILTRCCESKNRAEQASAFLQFYPPDILVKSKKTIQDTIHNSLENLTAEDLIVSFGRKTAQKWFINKVKLTAKGAKAARDIIKNRQLKLLK